MKSTLLKIGQSIVPFLFLLLAFHSAYDLWQLGSKVAFNDISDIFGLFGSFGDFFGGYIGTIIAAIGVIAVFINYKKEKIKTEKQVITNHFFELLAQHNVNVANLKKKSETIFSDYINTIKIMYQVIEEYAKEKKWNQKDKIKLSYLLFFQGVREFNQNEKSNINIPLDEINKFVKELLEQGINFHGTFEEIGIYFRQLFQLVTYVNSKKILTYDEKYELIKAVRVTLNIEEQYLLFLNSLVGNGLEWEKNKLDLASNPTADKIEKNASSLLITRYNLLKNIPESYFPVTGFHPIDEYPDIQYEFQGISETDNRKKS